MLDNMLILSNKLRLVELKGRNNLVRIAPYYHDVVGGRFVDAPGDSIVLDRAELQALAKYVTMQKRGSGGTVVVPVQRC